MGPFGEFLLIYGAILLTKLTITICASCWASVRRRHRND
jgi:hypothetical protein